MIFHQLTCRPSASALHENGRGQDRIALRTVLAVIGALALAGCEAHPYPSPAPDESAPPPAPPSQLMGAPQSGGPAPMAGDPARAPYPAPAAAPPQGGEIGPRDSYGARPPCPPDPSYRGPNAPSVIVCNAPIPNPPEREVDAHGWRGEWAHGRHHHHHRWAPYGYGPPAPYHVHHHPIFRRFGQGVAPAYPQSVHHHHHRHQVWARPVGAHVAPATGRHLRSHIHVVAPPARPVARLSPIVPIPVPAPHLHGQSHAHAHANLTSPASLAAKAAADKAVGGNVDVAEADRYGALQSVLTRDVGRQATLTSPSHFTPNQTSDVSLTLPAGFAQVFRNDAAAQKLGDAAKWANLTAALSGEGFTITPQEPQAQPIAIGLPIVFRWKVTPQADARGPIQADISAELLSQGHSLPLGSIKSLAGVSRLSGRVLGVGLLLLIALVLLAWAARRRRPVPNGATRPRANHMSVS